MTSCLVIKNDGMGDLILASGIIAELSKMFEGNLDLVTCRTNMEIAENLHGVNRCLYVSRDDLKLDQRPSHPGIVSTDEEDGDSEVLKVINNSSYDYAISLRRYIRESTLVLMDVARAEHKYCAWQFPTNISLDVAGMYSKGWTHYSGSTETLSELAYYHNFIENVFDIEIGPYPRLHCTDALSRQLEPMTVGLGIGPDHRRAWPVGYWIDLANRLQKSGWDVVLFGANDVAHLAGAIQQQSNGCTNLVGKQNIMESAQHLSGLSAFIGNDTGLLHLASLIVPKCLVLMGGGTFGRFFPWPGSTNQHVIFHALECFDCDWKCKYRNCHCMHLLHSSDVLDYFNDIINSDDTGRTRNLNPAVDNYKVAWRRRKGTPLSIQFPANITGKAGNHDLAMIEI